MNIQIVYSNDPNNKLHSCKDILINKSAKKLYPRT